MRQTAGRGTLRRLVGFEEDGVDVAFEVIDWDERLVECGGERFCVGDADEECAD